MKFFFFEGFMIIQGVSFGTTWYFLGMEYFFWGGAGTLCFLADDNGVDELEPLPTELGGCFKILGPVR